MNTMLYRLRYNIIILVISLGTIFNACSHNAVNCDILIIGGGASGVAAGIQAARMGSSTIIIEKTSWVGGMLTSAGVSCNRRDFYKSTN